MVMIKSAYKRVFCRFILSIILITLFLLIHSKEASAISFWNSYRIEISPANDHDDNYQVGERAAFNIKIKIRIFRFSFWRGFYYTYRYVDLPERNILATFPNYQTVVQLNRTGVGRYEYETPVLEGVGNKTLTVRIVIRFWRNYYYTLRRCSYTIHVQGPPTIEITDPLDGNVLNVNPITVSGTVDDDNANVEVSGEQTHVVDGTFTIDGIRLEEGENRITARAGNQFGETQDSVTVTLDTIPPQNSGVSIEGGNQTDERFIHLLLSAEGADEVIISENADFSGVEWEPYVERKQFTLSEGEGLKRIHIKFRDEAGNETEILQAGIILGHLLTVTSPQDGLTINASHIAVAGTVNDEGIPIYINDIPAKTVDNIFYINQFPLALGFNTITVQAYMDGELIEEITVNILTEELISPVEITANPLSGEPDLEVDFTVIPDLENPIANYAWDFDNDGRIDWQSQETGNTSYTYDRIRLYHPTITITDSNQTQFTATVTINIHLPRQQEWALEIEDPVDLAVDNERNLYILQRTSARIQKYDKDGNHIDTFGGQGQAPGQFDNPYGIALNQAGNIYIADTGNNRIQKLTPFGMPDETFGEEGIIAINLDTNEDGILDPGIENGQFNQPYGVAVDGEGNVYVTDTGNNRIQKFSAEGEFLLQWEVELPYGISADIMGDLFVANRNNNQVQVYSSMGSSFCIYENELNSPTDTTLSSNYLYIADTANNRIQKINKQDLVYVSSIETFTNEENISDLSNPVAVALDTDLQKEFIYVADSGNNRVVKIELPIVSPEETLDAMKEELSEANIEGALENFTEDSREKYREIFDLITDDLPETLNDMNDIHPISIQDNYAEYIVVREEDGQEYGYFITFVKDENGEWKIQGF